MTDDIGVVLNSKTQTQTNRKMTDRYRYGPEKFKLNWQDKKMVDRYRYNLENSN